MSNQTVFNLYSEGSAPEHEWSGTSVRFKNPDGSWGPFVDIRGDTGEQGNKGPQGPLGDKGPTTYVNCNTCKTCNCTCSDNS